MTAVCSCHLQLQNSMLYAINNFEQKDIFTTYEVYFLLHNKNGTRYPGVTWRCIFKLTRVDHLPRYLQNVQRQRITARHPIVHRADNRYNEHRMCFFSIRTNAAHYESQPCSDTSTFGVHDVAYCTQIEQTRAPPSDGT